MSSDSELLDGKIGEIIEYTFSGAVQHAPDVIAGILQMGAMSSITWISVSIFFIAASVKVMRYNFFKIMEKGMDSFETTDNQGGFAVAFLIFLIAAIVAILSAQDLITIYLHPKLYILNYIK